MDLTTMHAPQKDSPSTFITGEISSTDTHVTVGNSALLPSVVPFPLTLGIDKSVTEVVLVTEIGANDQLTVQRDPGQALLWASGTQCARVFNADDLSAVQANLTDVVSQSNSNTTRLDDDLDPLTAIVGDAGSGLVKDLSDEIARATAAEEAEEARAIAAEEALDSDKVNRTELPQVITDWLYGADGTELTVTITRYDATTQTSGEYTRTIPLVDDASVGIMTPEAYNEITALRTAVSALEQQGGRFIGVSFANKVDLDDYTIPATVNEGDFTYVLNDETQDDATTRYIYNGTIFVFGYVIEHDPVGLATSSAPGIVKGTTGVAGKIFVETDGTMSVVGWSPNATHTGDVTGATVLTIGSSKVTESKIANDAVTLAKMANMATGTLIYRRSGGTGNPEVQSLATLKTDLNITPNATHSGHVVGATVLTIADGSINNARLQAKVVTVDKIQDFTTGAVLVGVAGRPVVDTTPAFSGVHNHGGYRISNVGAPTTANDAATVYGALTDGRVPYISSSKLRTGVMSYDGTTFTSAKLKATDDINSVNAYQRNGSEGYLYKPLLVPVKIWNNVSCSSVEAYLTSTDYTGVPSNAKVLKLFYGFYDANEDSDSRYLAFYASSDLGQSAIGVIRSKKYGATWTEATSDVPVDSNNRFYYKRVTTGTNTGKAHLTIIGYYF